MDQLVQLSFESLQGWRFPMAIKAYGYKEHKDLERNGVFH